MGFPLAPWQMWGNEQVVTLAASSATPLPGSTTQLAKVNYGRPESWRFMFIASLLSLADAVPAGALVTVDFDLTIGVGRTAQTLSGFVHLTFDPPFAPPTQKWAGSGLEPARTPGATQRLVEIVPTQDIQCQARVLYQAGSGAGGQAVVSLAALFAPNVHLRPEWFDGPPDAYRGNEQGGT